MKYKIIIVGIIFAVILSISQLAFDTTQEHKILSIDKVENLNGDHDGFSTDVYYIVSTDKGAYHIRTTGINAAPECIGLLVDSTYLLRTRGVSIPLLGIYPCIIKKQ